MKMPKSKMQTIDEYYTLDQSPRNRKRPVLWGTSLIMGISGLVVLTAGLGLYQRKSPHELTLMVGWANMLSVLALQFTNAIAILRKHNPASQGSFALAMITFVASLWEASVTVSYMRLGDGAYLRRWQAIYLAGLVITMCVNFVMLLFAYNRKHVESDKVAALEAQLGQVQSEIQKLRFAANNSFERDGSFGGVKQNNASNNMSGNTRAANNQISADSMHPPRPQNSLNNAYSDIDPTFGSPSNLEMQRMTAAQRETQNSETKKMTGFPHAKTQNMLQDLQQISEEPIPSSPTSISGGNRNNTKAHNMMHHQIRQHQQHRNSATIPFGDSNSVTASRSASNATNNTAAPVHPDLEASIAHPIIAQALYPYEAAQDDPTEISFNKDEVLTIVANDGRWWRAKRASGETGIAPSNYLKVLSGGIPRS